MGNPSVDRTKRKMELSEIESVRVRVSKCVSVCVREREREGGRDVEVFPRPSTLIAEEQNEKDLGHI